jgi:predicted negative regulator of RcsB-dependent stress response
LIRERKFGFKYRNRRGYQVKRITRSWKDVIKIIILLAILVVGLIIFWYFFVYKPINQQNENIKKWNDEITDDSKSDVNIIKKVNGTDKDNFKSSENFDKYFENNQFDAFRSYFYYFHFNHLISKNNDESLKKDDIWKEIDNDYKQFSDTKKQYNVTINEDKKKYCFIVIA